MRPEVAQLAALGRFPHELDVDEADLAERERLVVAIEPPVTEEEARALVPPLGAEDDSLFGLAWSLVTLVESAPGWPYWDLLADQAIPWIAILRQGAINA